MIIHSTKLDTMAKVVAIYGGTKWQKIEGRFLLGKSAVYAINATGGEATHTLTVNEMPSHRHSIQWHARSDSQFVVAQGNGSNPDTSYTSYEGGNQAHNNMPPYKVVYIWERTE